MRLSPLLRANNHAQRGDMIVYPASSEHWVRWQEHAEFLLLFLEPDLVNRAAHELASHRTGDMIASEQEQGDPLMLHNALALKTEIDEGWAASSSLYAESLAKRSPLISYGTTRSGSQLFKSV